MLYVINRLRRLERTYKDEKGRVVGPPFRFMRFSWRADAPRWARSRMEIGADRAPAADDEDLLQGVLATEAGVAGAVGEDHPGRPGGELPAILAAPFLGYPSRFGSSKWDEAVVLACSSTSCSRHWRSVIASIFWPVSPGREGRSCFGRVAGRVSASFEQTALLEVLLETFLKPSI